MAYIEVTVDDKYDWTPHSRFNLSKADANIAVEISWAVESGCNVGSMTTNTHTIVMNEADPYYDSDKLTIEITSTEEDLKLMRLTGPNISFMPTDYVFSLEPTEANQSITWLNCITRTKDVKWTLKTISKKVETPLNDGDIVPLTLKF